MTVSDRKAPPLGHFGAAEVGRTAVVASRISTGVLAAIPGALRRRRFAAPASEALVGAFEDLGPTFVKLGQLVASSPGLFPAPLADACRRTLDRVPPAQPDEIRRTITDDLGAPPEEIFASFDPKPLSAASIAQVHACTLPDGREAVVKVQRPGLRRQVNADLRILHQLARGAARSRHLRVANPLGVIEDLHRVTNEEFDFSREAARQVAFRAGLGVFGDTPEVTAPEVYVEFCGARVICMERIRGVPVDRFQGDPARGQELLRSLVQTWLEAVCLHGPFHGDLHAGNLWLLDDGRIAFLDFGIMGHLDDEWRGVMRNLLLTLGVDGDFTRLVRDFVRLGVIDSSLADEDTMATAIESLAVPLLDSKMTEISLGEVLQAVLGSITAFGAVTPKELVLVAKQILYVERFVKQLAPDWQMARDRSLLRNIHPACSSPATEGLGVW